MRTSVIRTLGILTGIILITGIVGISASAAPPEKTPPDIKKIVFIHKEKPGKAAKPDKGGKPPKEGEVEGCDGYKLMRLRGNFVKWGSTPVEWEVNTSASGLNNADAIAALKMAFDEWDDGTYSGWGGVSVNLYVNEPSSTNAVAADLDGERSLVWEDLDAGVIASTSLWMSTLTGEIVDADIRFNTDFDWSSSGEAGKMDLLNIAVHEIGHFGGMFHPNNEYYNESMYRYSELGEIIKRDLCDGDQEGITKLYR
ncbi:MAG: matrixin family metalloprotease [Nitrososphaerales archaeon]